MKRFILFSFMIMFALSSVAYAEIGTEVNLSYIETYCVPALRINDLQGENDGSVIFCDTNTESDDDDKYFVCEKKSQFVHITEDNVCEGRDYYYAKGYYRCDDLGDGRGYAWVGVEDITGDKDWCCKGECYEYANNLYVNESGVYSELCVGGNVKSECEADESIVEEEYEEESVDVEEAPEDEEESENFDIIPKVKEGSRFINEVATEPDIEISPVITSTQTVFCYSDGYDSHVIVDEKKDKYIICNEENAYECDEASRFIYLPKGHQCVKGNGEEIDSQKDFYAKCDGSKWKIFDSIDDSGECDHTEDDSCYEYLIGADTYYVNNKGVYKSLGGTTYKKCSKEIIKEVVAADTGKLSATAGGETVITVDDATATTASGVTGATVDGATATTAEVLKHKDYEEILKELKGYKLLDRSVWKTEDGKFNTARLMVDVGSGAVLGTVGGVIANTVIRKNQISSGMEGYQCHINGQVVADYGDEFVVDIYK